MQMVKRRATLPFHGRNRQTVVASCGDMIVLDSAYGWKLAIPSMDC